VDAPATAVQGSRRQLEEAAAALQATSALLAPPLRRLQKAHVAELVSSVQGSDSMPMP